MWKYFGSVLNWTYVEEKKTKLQFLKKIIEWNLKTWGLRESGSQEPLEFFLVPHDIIELSRTLFIYKTRWRNTVKY